MAYFSLNMCAGMLPTDVLEMVPVRALLWGEPVFVYLRVSQVLRVAFLQCRQHLRVLVPRGMVLADRQGSGGPVVLSPWPTCLLLHRGVWGALLRATHTHTR